MPIGSMPSVSTTPGTSRRFWKNFSNQSSRLRPFQRISCAPCARLMSPGVGCVIVDFRAGLRDGLHDRRVAGDVLGNVGDDGEGGRSLEFILRGSRK
jgi:hypothetical protein